MAASVTLALKPGVWFRRGRLLIVSPDSLGTACPLSGRNSTYRLVQILEAGSSCCREKGSNARPSPYAACSTNGEPRNVINQTSQSLPPFALLAFSKTLMTDTCLPSALVRQIGWVVNRLPNLPPDRRPKIPYRMTA